MKIEDKKQKNYMYMSIAIILLSIYVILFPLISKGITKILPQVTQCTYLKITGKPCPLCGGTRYFENIGEAFTNIKYLWHPFGILFLCLIFEICFRLFCIYQIRNQKKLKRIITFDIIFHSCLLLAFLSYEIIFVLTT